jgi:hypothetical protein
MTKGKDLTRFVRFGGLEIKKQKGFNIIPKTFHSPPAPRGFYAMPLVAQELYLIGAMDVYQPGTTPKNLEYDETMSDEECAKAYDEYYRRRKIAISAMRREFTKRDGLIWHHLLEFVKPYEIIERHGEWVKTEVKVWQKAFSKMSLNYRYEGMAVAYDNIKSINESRGLTGCYSKDHCEVFFDEKV